LKKIALITLVLILVLGSFGLAACGGGDEGDDTTAIETEVTAEETTDEPEEETPTPAQSGDLTWNDMPVYSGASQIQKGSWAIPAEQGEWSKVEWRYFETSDGTNNVASFYRAEMLDKGWTEMMWMEAEGIAWAYYTKNGEKDGAMFWCSFDEDEDITIFAVMRATQ
jgi:hypothetical protein